jgi:hypothetical protein
MSEKILLEKPDPNKYDNLETYKKDRLAYLLQQDQIQREAREQSCQHIIHYHINKDTIFCIECNKPITLSTL